MMTDRIWRFLFPPKCVLCRQLLEENQTDFCHNCRKDMPKFTKLKFKPSFVARWTGMWYYKDNVRGSILRYKFSNKRSYASAYARALAMKLQNDDFDRFDVLTWVPVSPLRRLSRGYDQVALLAKFLGQELQVTPIRTLRKIRNTPPQSGIPNASRRRANVLGAYRAVHTPLFAGKKVLLLDDILTTGATAAECARVLLTAGASEVDLAVLAVANYDQSSEHNKNM